MASSSRRSQGSAGRCRSSVSPLLATGNEARGDVAGPRATACPHRARGPRPWKGRLESRRTPALQGDGRDSNPSPSSKPRNLTAAGNIYTPGGLAFSQVGGAAVPPRDAPATADRLPHCAASPSREETTMITTRANLSVMLLLLVPVLPARADETAEERAVEAIQVLRGTITRDEKSCGRPVIKVALGGEDVTDASLKYLADLPRLRTLTISESRVTDAGLKHLANLTRLEELYL